MLVESCVLDYKLQMLYCRSLTCDEVAFLTAEMDAEHAVDKRARLLASKSRWSEMGDVTATQPLVSAETGRMMVA